MKEMSASEDLVPALYKYDNIKTSSDIIVHIDVTEGRRYYMGGLHFTGNEVQSDKMLEYVFRLDSGAVFDQYLYDASRKALIDSYREDGYLFAQFDEESAWKLLNDIIRYETARNRQTAWRRPGRFETKTETCGIFIFFLLLKSSFCCR